MKLAVSLSAVGWLGAITATAQTPHAFEAVSVRHSGSNVVVMSGPGSVTLPSQPFRYTPTGVSCDLTLLSIIKEAFSIKEDYRVVGPQWITTERFRIAAVMPEGTPHDSARLMLQNMLRERFGLRYHLERKEVPVYALIEANAGFKLRRIDPVQAKERVIETPTGPKKGLSSMQGPGRLIGTAMSLDDFATLFLSKQIDAPVVNATGIPGAFEIDLRWEWDGDASRGPRRNNPEMLRAIERDLGLKLDRRNMPLEFITIEHVSKTPTEN